MKCPKCGYVSFDHLNNCMKCSRDLSDCRAGLNLLDFRPEVPFLLGSLVGEVEGGGAHQALSLTQETELDLGGLGISEPATPEGSIDMGDLEIPTEEPGSNKVSLSEIALDDLESIDDSDLGSKGGGELQLDDLAELDPEGSKEEEGFLGLEIESDEESLGGFEDEFSLEPEAPDETTPGDSGADLELDLDEHDLSALAKTLEDHLEPEGGKKKN